MARTVAQALVDQMADWGIRYAFGVMGESILGLVDAIRRQERVRFISTQHEQAAAFAASAYAKLTGRPAACLSIGGPGATSMMTGIHDAHSDRVPMLAITGDVRRTWRHKGAQEEIDSHSLFEAATVFNADVQTAPQAPLLIAGAIQAAVSRRGVAHLSIPADVQTAQAEMETIRPEGHMTWSASAASDEDIRWAARILNGAGRPLILAGSGALLAGDLVLEAARRLNAPILTSCRSKGLVPGSEPLSMGIPGISGTPLADSLMREADVILVIGSSLSQATTGNWQLIRPEQQLVQIDIDRANIGRLYAVEAGLWGDARETLHRLLPLLPEGQAHTEWGDLASRKQQFQSRVDAKATAASAPIKPQFLVRALQEALPADAVIALDSGSNAFFMCQQYQPKGEAFVSSYHLGSTGFALPAALGAALAFPDRSVVAVVGDGGLSFSLGELITAVQHNLPVAVVCFNNARLGMIDSEQEQAGMKPFFTERPAIDFGAVAQACGARGVHVSEPGALRPALFQAIEEHRPFVVDVAVDPMERESTALIPAAARVPA